MFITDERALVLERKLVIADMHLGITREIYNRGVSLPSQVPRFLERIHRLKKITGADELVLLGDVKHNIPWISFQELKEVPLLLSTLKFRKITILKGNHDGKIEMLVPRELQEKISVRKSMIVGDYLLAHGHRNVRTKRSMIIGHNHPNVKFVDAVGNSYIEPAWIKSKIGSQRVIIMPAFNELAGSMVVNDASASSEGYRPFLGPIAKKVSKERAKAFLLDGTNLGFLKDLKS
ncbi:MAG: metallophosphoesterase [Candidatus Aenigmarchaeota archaeon]|nr:metallophosphoesterase [Candidatus Aenigmarchaeota archaeon]